jgi:hypothetical protein
MSGVRSRLTGHMLLLAIGALTLAAVAVGVVARTNAVQHGDSSPATAVTSVPATSNPDADYLRQVCGSLPPTEGPSFCIGHDPSMSPSQLVVPGYED